MEKKIGGLWQSRPPGADSVGFAFRQLRALRALAGGYANRALTGARRSAAFFCHWQSRLPDACSSRIAVRQLRALRALAGGYANRALTGARRSAAFSVNGIEPLMEQNLDLLG